MYVHTIWQSVQLWLKVNSFSRPWIDVAVINDPDLNAEEIADLLRNSSSLPKTLHVEVLSHPPDTSNENCSQEILLEDGELRRHVKILNGPRHSAISWQSVAGVYYVIESTTVSLNGVRSRHIQAQKVLLAAGHGTDVPYFKGNAVEVGLKYQVQHTIFASAKARSWRTAVQTLFSSKEATTHRQAANAVDLLGER